MPLRLFIAVEIPSRIKADLAAAAALFDVHGATPVRDKALHITLNFLGNIQEEKVDDVVLALQGVHHTPFNVEIGGVGVFHRQRGSVVFASVSKGYDDLAALHNKISAALKAKGVVMSEEERPFTPHITLARTRDLKRGAIQPGVDEIRGSVFGSFVAEMFYLKKSTLTPQGPVHETVAAFPLQEK